MQTSASGGGKVSSGYSSGETYTPVETESGTETTVSSGGGGPLALVDYGDHDYPLQMLLDVAYVVPLNGDIQSLTRFTLTPFTIENNHNFLGLYVAGDIVELQPGSLPDRAVNNSWMLESGISYRYYFTPAHTFFSPYLSANVGYQLLRWDYRNAIIVNGDTITSDSLDAVGGYAGLGIAIKRNSHLSFFGEAGFGGTVFVGDTYQGFYNDVFSDFGYFTVKVGLSLKF